MQGITLASGGAEDVGTVRPRDVKRHERPRRRAGTLRSVTAKNRVDPLDVTSIGDATAFAVSSATDPDYVAPLSAAGIGIDRRAVAVTDTGTRAVV